MKKYLFLVGLFIVYLILIFRNDSKPVLSYQDRYDDGVYNITIKFGNGINSNELKSLFSNYTSDYYIENIYVNDDKISVSCNYINDCLNKIYDQEDNFFNTLYLTNGFRIKEINILAYKDDIMKFLNKNNLDYKIN